MRSGSPSRTALAAAAHRAAHQVLEGGRIFADPLALRILGDEAEAAVREAKADPSKRRMRLFIAVRTRFAEDALAAAVERGVRQLVVLVPASTRSPTATRSATRFASSRSITRRLRPGSTSDLAAAGIPLPASLTFAPINFEHETLAEGLAAAGFDREQPTFFTWLGVVPYLTDEAVWSTLTYIARLPHGAHVVFDYSDPPATFSPELRLEHDRRAAHVAALGEPWINYFEAATLRTKLIKLGFSDIED